MKLGWQAWCCKVDQGSRFSRLSRLSPHPNLGLTTWLQDPPGPLNLDTSVSPAKLQAAILILDKLFFMKTVVSNRKPQSIAGFFWACKNK